MPSKREWRIDELLVAFLRLPSCQMLALSLCPKKRLLVMYDQPRGQTKSTCPSKYESVAYESPDSLFHGLNVSPPSAITFACSTAMRFDGAIAADRELMIVIAVLRP